MPDACAHSHSYAGCGEDESYVYDKNSPPIGSDQYPAEMGDHYDYDSHPYESERDDLFTFISGPVKDGVYPEPMNACECQHEQDNNHGISLSVM